MLSKSLVIYLSVSAHLVVLLIVITGTHTAQAASSTETASRVLHARTIEEDYDAVEQGARRVLKSWKGIQDASRGARIILFRANHELEQVGISGAFFRPQTEPLFTPDEKQVIETKGAEVQGMYEIIREEKLIAAGHKTLVMRGLNTIKNVVHTVMPVIRQTVMLESLMDLEF